MKKMMMMMIQLLYIIFLHIVKLSYCQISLSSYNSLYSLYNTTNGLFWSWKTPNHWNFTILNYSDPCFNKWEGIVCNNNNNEIINITLSNLNMTGTISNIFNITSLVILNINNNKNLIGTIPQIIGNFSNLSYLDLSNNGLQGNLSNINFMNKKILYFSLFNNDLNGPFPNIAMCTKIRVLLLYNNKFTGTIPSLKSFNSLQLIYLNNNKFSGSFPNLPAVSSGQIINLGYNQLFSTIPSNLLSLSYRTILANNNNLYGTIPEVDEGNLQSLVSLDLSYNELSGSLSQNFKKLSSLEKLLLSNNHLTGPLVAMHSLKVVDLSSNHLVGTLSSSFFSIKLNTIVLSNNCLTGNIPSGICESTDLQLIAMDGLSINCGTDYLKKKKYMYGSIPACIFNFTKLQTLTISGNKLTGTISPIASNSQLSILNLAANRLKGDIPLSIQEHGNFTTIDLSNNQLYGNLDSFKTSDSTQFSLEVNRLSGDIPSCLNNIDNSNILEGNLFSCGSRPNYKILNKRGYLCGSLMLWCSLTSWGVIVILLYLVYIFSPEVREKLVLYLQGTVKASSMIRNKGIIHDVFVYIEAHSNARSSSAMIVIFSLLVFMTFYVCAKRNNYGIYEFQYGWTTTSAFLHGYIPAFLILGFVTIPVLLTGFWMFHSQYIIVDDSSVRPTLFSIISRQSSIKNLLRLGSKKFSSFRLNEKEKSLPQASRYYLIAKRVTIEVLVHIINVFLSLGVNILYVFLTQRTAKQGYPSSAIYTLQFIFALIKVAFTSVLTPSLQQFLKLAYAKCDIDKMQQHILCMNLINMIVAPVCATLIIAKPCFYYLTHPQTTSPISYSLSSEYCSSPIQIDAQSISTEFCLSTNQTYTYSVPIPFAYSYRCSSTVVTSYVPPLIFVYIISGLVIPFIKLSTYLINPDNPIILFIKSFPFMGNFVPFSTSLIAPSFVINKISDVEVSTSGKSRKTEGIRISSDAALLTTKQMFNPALTLQKYLTLPLTVMLTFGLSAPPLGVTIFASILAYEYLTKFMISKYLHHSVLDAGIDTETNVNRRDILEKNLSYAVKNLSNVLLEDNVLTIQSCWELMLIFTGMYWGFMIFDMIAEEKTSGVSTGILVFFVVTFIYTLLLWIIRILFQPVFSSILFLCTKKIKLIEAGSQGIVLDERAINRIELTNRIADDNKDASTTISPFQQSQKDESSNI